MKFSEEYFDEGLYRVGTRCEKWDACRQEHGESILPLWVADMDFPSPPAVQNALLRRAAHPTYGYTAVEPDDAGALCGFWRRRHGLTIAAEDVMMIPCVVTGIRLAILTLTQPGDGVIIQSPVYGPFRFSVEATGRRLCDAPLTHHADGRYEMDLDAVEAHLRSGARLMVLCSPHNPVGRVWSREELCALLALLGRYGAKLVCDEIHADFVYAPKAFTPILTLQQEGIISLCAASKTFNLAGLQQASLLCMEEEVRAKISREMERSGVRSGNIFALEATRAAYEEGDAWLDGLLSYLDGSRRLLQELVAAHLPKAVLSPMEGTYLAWLDGRAYAPTTAELMTKAHKAGVTFTGGDFFGQGGDGFLRVNIGCPRRYVEEGILRLAVALES